MTKAELEVQVAGLEAEVVRLQGIVQSCREELAKVEQINTEKLWLEHRIAQFKKAHAAMVDGFLS